MTEHGYVNSNHCAACKRTNGQVYYKANKEKILAQNKDYHARNRPAQMATRKAYYAKNKEATKAKSMVYYYENRDLIREKRKLAFQRWYAIPENRKKAGYKGPSDARRAALVRYRARKAGAIGSYSVSEWRAIMKSQRGRCAMCQQKCKLTADHVVPIILGGSNMACNIQGLCGSCNSSKQAKLLPGTQLGVFDRLREEVA